ncbi:hypothetical protein Patl1_14370 [Pistacia atlantica]|uniref:Uncharacterized protein n=1 Tax=Pistacia atlantica TaxID=434234 RepID=A0ACC1ASC8_9ROSI|nr:hypothetical protein Patl1_14370 [Pistacia atlantica]
MKTIALNGDNQIEIKFNDKGQPIDEESVKLSSFLGPLGREIVPFTIPDWRKLPSDMREKLWKCVQEWQKYYVLKEMGALWRTSKSRLVSNNKMAKNEEERMALKPNNIKSINKKKTGKRVVSRVEVWIEAHKKKNGEPIYTKTAKAIEKLQQMGNDSSLPTPTNLREDAITKVLDPDKGGHVKGLGKGVTLTQLSIIAQRDNLIAQMAQQQSEIKMEKNYMKNLLNLALNQSQRQTVEESEDVSIVKTIPQKTKCKLLDWSGSTEVVAKGCFSSDDPKALVHRVPIGPDAMRVWIDIAKVPNAFLWRSASEMVFVEDVVGSIVAWPSDKVVIPFRKQFKVTSFPI